jgi:hypothetical protein
VLRVRLEPRAGFTLLPLTLYHHTSLHPAAIASAASAFTTTTVLVAESCKCTTRD